MGVDPLRSPKEFIPGKDPLVHCMQMAFFLLNSNGEHRTNRLKCRRFLALSAWYAARQHDDCDLVGTGPVP